MPQIVDEATHRTMHFIEQSKETRTETERDRGGEREENRQISRQRSVIRRNTTEKRGCVWAPTRSRRQKRLN